MLKTGQIIKDLRKKQDVTQEKLAAYLNISYQAISKWENGTALPDITLIPQIANFFGITADELLGMKENEQTEELKEYEKEYHENRRNGKMGENIVLARKVLKKYPRHYQWMLNLAYPLSQYDDTEEHNSISKTNRYLEEAIKICETILEDCTTDSIRHSAIQILCYNYSRVNEAEKAIALAETMPTRRISKDALLEHILCGEERIKQLQSNLVDMIDESCGLIYFYSAQETVGKELSPLQIIDLLQTANGLLQLVFKTDDNYLFYNDRLWRNYFKISEMYIKANNFDMAFENILLAEKYAIQYDKHYELGVQKHNSLLTDRLVFDPNSTSKNWEGNCKELLLQMIENNPHICKMTDNPDFIDLLNRLKKS